MALPENNRVAMQRYHHSGAQAGMRNMILTAVLLVVLFHRAVAQEKKQKINSRWALSFSTGIVPLPGRPISLLPGVEFFITPRISLYNEVALQTGRGNSVDCTAVNRRYFR
jgi:hypothetical protein